MNNRIWFLLLLVTPTLSLDDECLGKVCINFCCPKGESFKTTEEKSHRCDLEPVRRQICAPHGAPEELVWEPVLWQNGTIIETRDDSYILSWSTSGLYKCPEGDIVNIHSVFGDHQSRLQVSGTLQGSPLVITVITALVDSWGSCSWSLPNMGQVSCFLGQEYKASSYFSNPEFLYFYLFIYISISVNIICFFTTIFFLIKHWLSAEGTRANDQEGVAWSLLVFKIFIIMGIPWTLEVISHGIEISQDENRAKAVTYILDIFNLLTGVIIFAVLVCRESVWNDLKKTTLRRSSGNTRSSGKTSVTSVLYRQTDNL